MANTQQQHVSCGRDLHCVPDIADSTQLASVAGFDFVAVPIVHPRFKREFVSGAAKDRPGAFTRSDLLLSSHDWSSLVVGKVSPWLQLDAEDETIRKNSELALKQELAYAGHLSMPAVLVNLTSGNCVNFGRVLLSHMLGGYNQQLWVHVPMVSPCETRDRLVDDKSDSNSTDSKNGKDNNDTWEWWNSLRTVCDSHKKLSLALEVSIDLPSKEVIDRWLGEPIKCAILPTTVFLTNKKGYPVLSKAHQQLVIRLHKLDVQMMITGTNRHPDKGIRAYVQYMDHLYQSQPPMSGLESFAKGYEDYLQCPLQPLADNLESQTYEIFEKDPVKYTQYEKAIYYALLDRVPTEEKAETTLILMVLGAGRGPLVRASLQAAKKADRQIKIYAVEKNPNAVVTLQALQDEMWGDQVSVISTDMRLWEAPEKADIIVSELLGSFGDNELSPECLDGAQMFLKDDGISIPKEYTSYLSPVSSHKLYNEVRLCKDKDKIPDAHFETPYVVRLHNVNTFAEAVPMFTFVHPNRTTKDNSRVKTVTFDVEIDSVLHGFAGYFDTILYGDITLSIVPKSHSEGMFSWFPIFFPIKEPIYLRKSDKVTVTFWRNITAKNIWYEWCVTEPIIKPIHNPNGRSYTIGL
ncbi:protein arginine N-methyltransferase 5-like [Glandiceps talaboti]